MIVYFSGTGNSRYAAELFAARLGDALADAGALIRAGTPAALSSDRPWVFASPTYAWRLPRVFSELLLRSRFAGSKDAYFVMTCGSGIGNAGAELPGLCTRLGLTCRGVLEVVMPENYVAMFDVPEAAEAAKILAAARPVLEAGAETVRRGESFPAGRIRAADRIRTRLINPAFYRFAVRAKPFYATEACVSCGRCESLCPLGNIRLAEGRPRWGDRCTHCMACICGCPAQAIEYGRKSLGKPRYVCPPFEG